MTDWRSRQALPLRGTFRPLNRLASGAVMTDFGTTPENLLFLRAVCLIKMSQSNLLISFADFVHVNTMLDLVKLPTIFRSTIIDPSLPVIRTKEAFKFAFWVPVHPFEVSASSRIQPVVEVDCIRAALCVQAICLQDVSMWNDLWIVLHPVPVK